MKRRIRTLGAVVVAISGNAVAGKALGDFTAGDLVVLQVGLDGNSTALQSAGTAVQLDEFSTIGSRIMDATVDLPTTAGEGGVNNQPLTISGTAGSEGALNLSANGQYLVVAGYDVGVGGTTQGASTIGLIDASGTVDSSTTTDLESGNNTRSATSIDGTEVWVAGANTVVAVAADTSGGTAISTRNSRDVVIAPASVSPTGSAQLYTSAASSSHQGIFAMGSGTPTSGAQSATLLSGMSGGDSPGAFFFANPTTLFVADFAAGLQEWTESGGTWSNSATLTGQYAGLTGVQNGGTVTLYATTATSSGISAQNSLISDVFTFDSGTSGTGTFGTATTLATAAAFTEFGGVAFAPASASAPIWNGGGSDDNWSTGGNWGGTAPAAGALLEFAGTTRLSNNNDIAAGTEFGDMQFDSGSGAFVLGGNAINLGGDVVNNSGSTQTINLDLSLQEDVNLNAATGNITINGAISGGFSVSTPGGNTVTLGGSNSYSGGTNVMAGTVVIAAAGALPANGAVSITGGTLQLAAGTGGETLSSLSVTGGDLDVGNNHIVISDPGGSIDSVIRGYLMTGYNGGNWNGTGIETTAATGTKYGIGYADGADGGISGIVSGQLEVKYTLDGDTDLDGTVNSVDFGNLAANFGKSGKVWDQGDFNYDGTVNSVDFGLLAGNFGKSLGSAGDVVTAADWAALNAFAAANGLTAAVPEPASAGLMLLAGVGVLARRRRAVKV
jgi:autotransporter-associated beta strand protein